MEISLSTCHAAAERFGGVPLSAPTKHQMAGGCKFLLIDRPIKIR
jgi:hypothetical protein